MKTYRVNLNENQKTYLKLMYKFRFVSIPLLSRHKGISHVAVKRSLKTLEERGYVQRRFIPSYFKQNKPASFGLNKQSIKYFKDNFTVNESVLHTMYKNSSASDTFVDQCLDVYRAYIEIEKNHPDAFHLFTRAETAEYEETFPAPQPNLYINRITQSHETPNDYMLDLFHNVQTWVIKKRIDQYIEHFESGNWEEDVYPTVLLVCEDSKVEKTIREYIEVARDNALVEDDELQFMTTTRKALFNDSSGGSIWSNVNDPDLLISL